MMTRFASSLAFLFFVSILDGTIVFANETSQIGTITRTEGNVVLLSNPKNTIEGQGPHVRYDNQYYRYIQAKEGDRVEYGNVVRTNLGAKARIIYDNGDQYTVGDGTAFKVKWNRSPAAAAPAPELNLLHGKIRAIISKDGPRNRLNIRTKSATMGVRGTDFFVSSREAGKAIEVAVIRGAVELKPKEAAAKSVSVKKGSTAALQVTSTPATSRGVAAEKAPAPSVIRVEKTTKEELAIIQTTSVVTENRHRELASSEPKTESKIKELEKKAVETTLKDIKTHDPELYAKLDTKALEKSEDLNAAVVTTAIKDAPVAPEDRKPFGIDLDNGDDAYNKYFNSK